MRTIWKYIMEEPEMTFDMPEDAQLLGVEKQRESVTFWALVDPDFPRVQRTFVIRGTGHPFDSRGLEYVGSALVADGALVWHVFEVLDNVHDTA